MSYVSQGDVDYNYQPGESFGEWTARIALEKKRDEAKATIDKKIEETQKIIDRINGVPTNGSGFPPPSNPNKPSGLSDTTIVAIIAASVGALYLIQQRK